MFTERGFFVLNHKLHKTNSTNTAVHTVHTIHLTHKYVQDIPTHTQRHTYICRVCVCVCVRTLRQGAWGIHQTTPQEIQHRVEAWTDPSNKRRGGGGGEREALVVVKTQSGSSYEGGDPGADPRDTNSPSNILSIDPWIPRIYLHWGDRGHWAHWASSPKIQPPTSSFWKGMTEKLSARTTFFVQCVCCVIEWIIYVVKVKWNFGGYSLYRHILFVGKILFPSSPKPHVQPS